MQISLVPLSLSFLFLGWAEAAGKTHIYIDQIPLYTRLQLCAQDQVSAIVRAQASGCGDDTQLTSFACFCIDSSSEFSSIISTAVADECKSAATAPAITARDAQPTRNVSGRLKLRAIVTAAPTPTPTGAAAANVASALEAFDSYCKKSTELTRFNQQATVIITQAPQTVYVTPNSSPNSNQQSTPIAAIVAPLVSIPIILAAAMYFFLRRRHAKKSTHPSPPPPPEKCTSTKESSINEKETEGMGRLELFGDQHRRVEMAPNSRRTTKVQELESYAVELEGGVVQFPGKGAGDQRSGWI